MKALVVVAAIPLSVDALYDVLDDLAPLLRREEAVGETILGEDDESAMTREESAARRQSRRNEREGTFQTD